MYDEWNDIKLLNANKPLLRALSQGPTSEDPRTTYQSSLDWVLSNVSQLYVRGSARYG